MSKLRWDRLPKPWTKEQCRSRYVRGGDNIGLRALAGASGQPRSSLEKWSRAENWVELRQDFQGRLDAATTEKLIEETSNRLSISLADVAVGNSDAHEFMKAFMLDIAKFKHNYWCKLKELPIDPTEEAQQELKSLEEKIEKVKKYLSHHDLNQLSQAIARSTQEIAAALGLPYFVSVNASYKKLKAEGYEIVEPSQDEAQDASES